MKTICKTLYEFDNLSDEAKEKAREWFKEGGFDYEWHDTVYDDAKEIGKLMGIDISEIYFSGFWSQGDGACFEGTYNYAKDSVKKLTEYAPTDKELSRIVKELYQVQRRNFFKLEAHVKHTGHYYHSHSTEIDVYNTDDTYRAVKDEEVVAELLRDFMDWIYKMLEQEWDYLNSDEHVDETIRINEYTFDKDGNRDG